MQETNSKAIEAVMDQEMVPEAKGRNDGGEWVDTRQEGQDEMSQEDHGSSS